VAKLQLYKKAMQTVSNDRLRGEYLDASCFELSNLTHSMPERHHLSTLPSITPPYENMWLEARNSVGSRWGYFLQRSDRKDMDGVRWQVIASVHVAWGKRIYVYDTVLRVLLNQEGNIIPVPYDDVETYVDFKRVWKQMIELYTNDRVMIFEHPKDDEVFSNFGVFLAYALALLNAKNVEMVDSEKGKRGKRRGRHKGDRHYTLRIRLGGRKSASDSQSTGDKNAFHFARGHFKTYTEDAPLLGKHVGTYWWEAHTRGSKVKGTITKDYEVHPPIEENKETTK
jgi:hypothetical protein